MKKLLQSLFENHLTGAYSIKVGKKYISFPKLAPVMTAGFLSLGLSNGNEFFKYAGIVILLVGLVGFFYYNIFPSRLPKKK